MGQSRRFLDLEKYNNNKDPGIPMMKSEYRQFYRLVTDQVGLWYEQHSTPNPNGVVPDSNITSIVQGNKFEQNNDCIHAQ